MRIRTLILGICAAIITTTSLHARTLIYAGKLIDGVRPEPQKEVTIVVDGDRIVEVAAGFQKAAADDKVIDLKDATVLPGLMDMHVHLSSEHSLTSYTDRFFLSTADLTLHASDYAKRTLL